MDIDYEHEIMGKAFILRDTNGFEMIEFYDDETELISILLKTDIIEYEVVK